ncbi:MULTISPECIES: hypothetical protein [Sporomusa]|uniref:hypothetical protein n=1 Tax=Sporomusa TaxID=2375 RepID=UPI0031580BEE
MPTAGLQQDTPAKLIRQTYFQRISEGFAAAAWFSSRLAARLFFRLPAGFSVTL